MDEKASTDRGQDNQPDDSVTYHFLSHEVGILISAHSLGKAALDKLVDLVSLLSYPLGLPLYSLLVTFLYNYLQI